MKKSLLFWQTVGFVLTGIMGVLLHFLFDWTGGNALVAPFSAVNESVWEHMKILFFPMFLFALAERRLIGQKYQDFWCVKLIGIVLGVILIPVLYYTICGILGTIADWVNIAIFFITVAVSYWVETQLFKQNSIHCQFAKTSLSILWLVALLFVVLTFVPPHIPLFEDPITNTYGYMQSM